MGTDALLDSNPSAHCHDGSSLSPPQTPADLTGISIKDGFASADPLTTVHPDERSVGFIPPFPLPPVSPNSAELNQTFRHSFWKLRRVRTLEVLNRRQTSADVLDRFRNCGTSSWVLRDPENPDRYRLATNRCRHRWCEACSRDKQRIVVGNLRTVLQDQTVRLLTLTLAARDEPLSDQLKRITESFRLFRHRRQIARCMTGGIYFLEITYNDQTERWHPHLHVVFAGSYLPHALAKTAWLDITGDSYIIDLRPLNGANGAASYVAKYATKAVGASVWTNPTRLNEAIGAMAGKRTFQPFGDWTDLGLSDPPTDDTAWETVDSLANLIRNAKRGDKAAVRILTKLANQNEPDAYDLLPDAPDTS